MEAPKGWSIHYKPKPILERDFDWDYVHEDYDGAPDSNDNRCGNAESFEACCEKIAEFEDKTVGEQNVVSWMRATQNKVVSTFGEQVSGEAILLIIYAYEKDREEIAELEEGE